MVGLRGSDIQMHSQKGSPANQKGSESRSRGVYVINHNFLKFYNFHFCNVSNHIKFLFHIANVLLPIQMNIKVNETEFVLQITIRR